VDIKLGDDDMLAWRPHYALNRVPDRATTKRPWRGLIADDGPRANRLILIIGHVMVAGSSSRAEDSDDTCGVESIRRFYRTPSSARLSRSGCGFIAQVDPTPRIGDALPLAVRLELARCGSSIRCGRSGNFTRTLKRNLVLK